MKSRGSAGHRCSPCACHSPASHSFHLEKKRSLTKGKLSRKRPMERRRQDRPTSWPAPRGVTRMSILFSDYPSQDTRKPLMFSCSSLKLCLFICLFNMSNCTWSESITWWLTPQQCCRPNTFNSHITRRQRKRAKHVFWHLIHHILLDSRLLPFFFSLFSK